MCYSGLCPVLHSYPSKQTSQACRSKGREADYASQAHFTVSFTPISEWHNDNTALYTEGKIVTWWLLYILALTL